MSCYIVEQENINRIVSFIEKCVMSGDCYEKSIIRPMSYWLKNDPLGEDYRILCDLMDEMNNLAYDARYKTESKYECRFPYAYKTALTTNKHQGLKSLQCFLYQCTEGEQPLRPLYKALEEMKNNLAVYIVEQMQEYKDAKWD